MRAADGAVSKVGVVWVAYILVRSHSGGLVGLEVGNLEQGHIQARLPVHISAVSALELIVHCAGFAVRV